MRQPWRAALIVTCFVPLITACAPRVGEWVGTPQPNRPAQAALPTWTPLPEETALAAAPTLTPYQPATLPPDGTHRSPDRDDATSGAGGAAEATANPGPQINHFSVFPRQVDWWGEAIYIDWDAQGERIWLCWVAPDRELPCEDVTAAPVQRAIWNFGPDLCPIDGVRIVVEGAGQAASETLPLEIDCARVRRPGPRFSLTPSS